MVDMLYSPHKAFMNQAFHSETLYAQRSKETRFPLHMFTKLLKDDDDDDYVKLTKINCNTTCMHEHFCLSTNEAIVLLPKPYFKR